MGDKLPRPTIGDHDGASCPWCGEFLEVDSSEFCCETEQIDAAPIDCESCGKPYKMAGILRCEVTVHPAEEASDGS